MRAFEDFRVGEQLPLGPLSVDDMSGRWFPARLPGLDPEIISGWHAGALFMKMFHAAVLDGSTSQGGPGMESIRWLAPIHIGDVLSGTAEVTSARVSASRPQIGLVSFSHQIESLERGPVMRLMHTVMFGRRSP